MSNDTNTPTITEFLLARIAEDEVRSDRMLDRLTWARRLRECAAKRAIIGNTHWQAKTRPADTELHRTRSHPAYEYDTTEGPRKAWDDADVPPEGDEWERNTDAGRDGWDRLDYTEESYWRRLKPEGKRREWKQHIPFELRALATVYSDHPDYQQEWAL